MPSEDKQLKGELARLYVEHSKKTTQLQQLKKDIEAISAEEENITGQYGFDLSRKRTLAEEDHKNRKITPIQENISRLRIDLRNTKEKKVESLRSISLDKFINEKYEGSPFARILSVLEDYYQRIESEMGEEFIQSIKDEFKPIKLNTDEGSIDSIDKHIEQRLGNLKGRRASFDKKKLSTFIENTLRTFESNRSAIIVGSLTALVVMPLGSLVYIPYTVISSATNVRSISDYKNIIKDYLVLKYNEELYNKLRRNEAVIEFNKAVQKSIMESDSLIKEKAEALEQATRDLTIARNTALDDFMFDTTELENSRNNRLSSFSASKIDKTATIRELENDITNLTKEIQAKNMSLNEFYNKMREDFYALKADSFDVPKSFVTEINDSSFEELSYIHGMSLIFGDKQPSLDDFARLVIYQIVTNMHPSAYRIQVWDTSGLGTNYSAFSAKETTVFIKDSVQDINEQLATLVDTVRARRAMLSTGFDSLSEYNKYLSENESVIESYKFIFIINPDNSVLSSSELKSLCSTGKNFGIYIFILERASKVTVDYLDLIEYTSNTFNIEKNSIGKLHSGLAIELVHKVLKNPGT